MTLRLQNKLNAYRELKLQADALEAEIKTEIAELGKTVKYSGIVAKYNAPRKFYKYQDAALEHASEDIICKHTKPTTDWRAVCKDAGLINIPFTEGAPSVSIKITDKEEDIW